MNIESKTKEELIKEFRDLQEKYNAILDLYEKEINVSKQTEEIEIEGEKEYRNLIHNMPDGVYKSTEEGRFIDANPALVKMLGYDSLEELMAIDIKTQLYFDLSERYSVVLQEKERELGMDTLNWLKP